jgi:hypothetical protein
MGDGNFEQINFELVGKSTVGLIPSVWRLGLVLGYDTRLNVETNQVHDLSCANNLGV